MRRDEPDSEHPLLKGNLCVVEKGLRADVEVLARVLALILITFALVGFRGSIEGRNNNAVPADGFEMVDTRLLVREGLEQFENRIEVLVNHIRNLFSPALLLGQRYGLFYTGARIFGVKCYIVTSSGLNA